MELIGSINEKGYLNGFSRRGFDYQKCILELMANSLDALDKVSPSTPFTRKMLWDVKREGISLVDNAFGMLPENIENMYSLHRENHSSDYSRGVSGIGAKPAQSILSDKNIVYLLTHRLDGPFLHVTAPWDVIHEKGVYTGMIQVRLMTEDEMAEYYREREENGMLNNGHACGTTTRFPNNDGLRNALKGIFNPIAQEDAEKNPLNRPGVVFGHDNVTMIMRSYDNPNEVLTIQPYNYFAKDAKFYKEKSEYIIQQFRCESDNHDRFILLWGNRRLEITKQGRGFNKDPTEVKVNLVGYSLVGEYTVVSGLRYDPSLFDEEDPKRFGASKDMQGDFNIQHLGDNEEFLGSYKLVRNNQTIGLIPPPDIKITSARGSSDSYLDTILVQTEIRFNPMGNHDNHQDRVTGIQENKNQYNGANVPITLSRLVAYAKKQKAIEIRAHIDRCIEQHTSRTPPQQEEGYSTDSSDVSVAAPVVAAPVVAAPVEVEPVEVAPVVAAPVEVEPVEVEPVEVAPSEKEDATESEEEIIIDDSPIMISGSEILSHLQQIISSERFYRKDEIYKAIFLLSSIPSEASAN